MASRSAQNKMLPSRAMCKAARESHRGLHATQAYHCAPLELSGCCLWSQGSAARNLLLLPAQAVGSRRQQVCLVI